LQHEHSAVERDCKRAKSRSYRTQVAAAGALYAADIERAQAEGAGLDAVQHIEPATGVRRRWRAERRVAVGGDLGLAIGRDRVAGEMVQQRDRADRLDVRDEHG